MTAPDRPVGDAVPPGEPEVTLRPGRAAAGWSAASLPLVAAGGWFVADSNGAPVAWLVCGLFVAVAAFFLAQLVAPRLFTVRLDAEGIQVRLPWQRVEVAWDRVVLARVRRSGGDPSLRLYIQEDAVSDGEPPGARGDTPDDRPAHVVDVLLPVGGDLRALHRALAHHLGGPHVQPSTPADGAEGGPPAPPRRADPAGGT